MHWLPFPLKLPPEAFYHFLFLDQLRSEMAMPFLRIRHSEVSQKENIFGHNVIGVRYKTTAVIYNVDCPRFKKKLLGKIRGGG